MAEMIPDRISDDAPESERVIFENLRDSPNPVGRYWKVFHGQFVDNPNNPVRPRELDFVIFMEEDYCSVIYLEAKGGHYAIRDDMRWYSASSGQPVIPSPPTQASSGMYALQRQFEPYFGDDSLISLGCAVAFTDWDVEFSHRPMELAELITRRDALDPDKLIERLADYADKLRSRSVKERLRNNNRDYFATLRAMENLRSDFVKMYMPIMAPEEEPVGIIKADLETLRLRLLSLTVEQMVNLNAVTRSERSIVDGAAGTGKTVLAMELARRRYEAGESVALLCSNSNLSARFERWAETLPKEGDGRIVCGTPATLPLKILSGEARARHQQRLENSPDLEGTLRRGYLDSAWERFIEDTVADLGQEKIFDYLIVDEAQNLCDEVFLKLQDALLRRGLIGGRWAMFGDFVNQNLIRDSVEGDGKEALREWVRVRTNGLMDTNWYEGLLEINCRNTQEIADEVARLARVESPPRRGVHGPLVQTIYYESDEELHRTLDRLAHEWREIGYQSRQMILLSSVDCGLEASPSYGSWDLLNIRDAELGPVSESEQITWVSGDTSPRTLRYSDVYDFQGLESDLAILILPLTEDQVVLAGGVTLPHEDHLNRVLYTGMSRATTMLIIVAHESYRGILENRRSLYEAVHSGVG